MNRNDHGFTLIEIVVVLVLVSIIATTVFTRSITTDQINLSARTEAFKSHIRYAQSLAMKRSEYWGIFGNGSEYWLFGPWVSPMEITSNPVRLPGQESDRISMSDLGLDINPPFVIYFDSYGKPFEFMSGALMADLAITIEKLPDRTQSRSFNITAETGLITTP